MKKVLSLILVVAMIAAMGIVTASAAGEGRHTAYDICYLSSSQAKAMPVDPTKSTHEFGDITDMIDGGDAGLVFAGWHTSEDTIEAYGYSINGGEISWTGSKVAAEQPVIDAASTVPGCVDVTRFMVVVPFTTGDDNVIEIYCKNASDEYVFWTATYTCYKDFSIMKEINFDDQADSEFANTTGSPLMSDSNFASFISAIYKIEDGKLVVKDFSDIRWWALTLTPVSPYLVAEFDVNVESILSAIHFSVNESADATANGTDAITSNQGAGGRVISIVASETAGKLNVVDNQSNVITTIDAGKDYTLSAIFEVGTDNYYIAVNGTRIDVECTYPVPFYGVNGLRIDMDPKAEGVTDESVATFDNIIVKNSNTNYPLDGEEVPSEQPSQTPTQKPSGTTTQQPSGGDNTVDTADNTAIVFMIAAAAFVVTVLLKKRAY